jgi:single-strand DNA-binding protein
MMDDVNVVVLVGRVTQDPLVRELPGGATVTQLEIATKVDGAAKKIPVALHERSISLGVDDLVVVVGQVQRRFFRSGGSTQSRTEVVASDIVPARRRATVAKLLAGAIEALAPAS